MAAGRDLNPVFQHNQYLLRRKFFRIFGGAFYAYDQAGNLVFYADQKRFRLREDFRVYSDPGKKVELLRIKTPQILDLWANYTVVDSTTGETVGALRRKALSSMLRDTWELKAPDGRQIGTLTESSLLGALLSRWWNIIPQKYLVATENGKEIARIKQHFNPIFLKYTLSFLETAPAIDRRLVIAAGILIAGIEQRQEEMPGD